MLDDKKIEEAAYRFATSQTHGELLALIDGYKEGYKDSINEFLKDLWHPASEEPDVRHKTIICLYEDGHICQDYDAYDEATESDKLGRKEFKWNYYAEDNEIKKWCYATDLLPKKGGEQ